MSQNNCIIDEKVNEFIMSVKKYKLVLFVTLTINILVGSFIFMIWYLYTYSLSNLEDTKIISDIIGSIGSVLGGVATVVLAIFAWLAYKYAISAYEKQAKINETTKVMMKHYITIISEINLALSNVQTELIHVKAFNESVAKQEYKTLEEIKIKVIKHNKVSRIMNKRLSKIMTKLSVLRKEVIIYSNVFVLSKNAVDNINKLIADIAGRLYHIIVNNQETRKQFLLKISKGINTEALAITELITFFDNRAKHFKSELEELNKLIDGVVKEIPQIKDIWVE